jgi:hypothetical protein
MGARPYHYNITDRINIINTISLQSQTREQSMTSYDSLTQLLTGYLLIMIFSMMMTSYEY